MSKTKSQQKEETTITIHLPIDKGLDEYLTALAKKEERTRIAQIRYILSDYMKKNPLKETGL